METVKIYLAGGMTGLSLEEQMKWRKRFVDALTIQFEGTRKKPEIFNPPKYYSPSTYAHKSEKEVMEFELAQLRKSDVIVVNFNVPQSIGTAMELIVAKENKIPVIGLNESLFMLHPWLEECCTRICDNFRELVEHIVDFYLS